MRRIAIIAIPVVVAALLALLVVTRLQPKGDTLPDNLTNLTPPPATTVTNTPVPTKTTAETTVVAVSRNFAERYASTSTASPTGNLAAALPFASASLAAAFQRTMASSQPPTVVVITTASQALAFNVQYIDETNGRAAVKVSLQRTERKGAGTARVYTQDISLQLIREAGNWKVNLAVFANG